MAKEKGYTIEVTTHEPMWWCYNVAFTAGCFDKQNERIGYASAQSHIADVGSNAEPPQNALKDREIRLETMPCDHLLMYLYVIPHTLPKVREIEATQPFAITLTISYNGKFLRKEQHSINRWSGASLELHVTKD